MHANPDSSMKSSSIPLLVAVAVVAAMATALGASAQRIVKYDAPGAGTAASQGTIAVSINPIGQIAGYYVDANNLNHGFLRMPNGRTVPFDAPGAGNGPGPCPINLNWCSYQGTYPFAINWDGTLAGYSIDANNVYHGFLRSPEGRFKILDAKGAGTDPGQGTVIASVNAFGAAAGYFTDANGVSHGIVRSPDGKIVKFDAPGAGTGPAQGTYTQYSSCLAVDGTITGFFIDANNMYHGYVRHPEGRFTVIDAPNAGTGPFLGTVPYSISDAGDAVGPYYDASNVAHGFMSSRHGSFTTIDVPGAGINAGQGTVAATNNQIGQIAGWWVDANNVSHGFVLNARDKLAVIDVPGAGTGAGQGTTPMIISLDGIITGFYVDSSSAFHTFIRLPK